MRRLPPPPDTPAQRRLLGTRSVPAYLPWAAVYPLRGSAPIVLAMLAAGTWYFSQNAFGLQFLLMFSGAALHYLFFVLERSALGYADPPPLTASGFLRYDGRAFKFLLVVALVLVPATHFREGIGPAAELAWLAFWLSLLPGVLVLLALEERLRVALHPRNLAGFVLHGGPWYWLSAVALAWVVLAIGAQFRAWSALDVEGLGRTLLFGGRTIGELVLTLAVLYVACAGLHLLGFTTWRRREALGIEAQVSEADETMHAQAAMIRRTNALLAAADRLADEQRHEDAERLLLSAPLDAGDTLTQLDLLFEDAARRPRAYVMCAIGQRYIRALLAARQTRRALDVAERCLDRFEAFEAFRPAQTAALATEAFSARRESLFERLAAGIEARHATSPERVELGFLRARTRAERHGDDGGALAILAALPEHPEPAQRARILAYRAALERARRR